jgi:hypothetical protein
MNWLGNSPRKLGERSGLTCKAMRREWWGTFGRGGGGVGAPGRDSGGDGGGRGGDAAGLIDREGMLAKLMSYGLSHNLRLGAVHSPCIVDESSANGEDGPIRIRPNPATRFFTNDVQHELCIYLGLAELLGFDLECDMKTTLYVVRWLERWMKKEFVLPHHGGDDKDGNPRRLIVSSARDLAETSAPQAFRVPSV